MFRINGKTLLWLNQTADDTHPGDRLVLNTLASIWDGKPVNGRAVTHTLGWLADWSAGVDRKHTDILHACVVNHARRAVPAVK